MIDIGYAGALLGGLLTLLSPCSAVMLPGFFAYAFRSPHRLAARSLVFYAGLVSTLVPLGVAASALGALLNRYRDIAVTGLSALIIALGVVQILGLRLRLPWPASGSSGRVRDATVPLSVYLLGLGYGLAGVCSGPILGSVLAVAALGSGPLYGGTLLAVYALGMALPVFVLALLWERFDVSSRRLLRPRALRLGLVRTTTVGVLSGSLFVIIGILMLATGGTTDLGGVLTTAQQFRLEERARAIGDHIPDLVITAVLAGVVAVLLVLRHLGRAEGSEAD